MLLNLLLINVKDRYIINADLRFIQYISLEL